MHSLHSVHTNQFCLKSSLGRKKPVLHVSNRSQLCKALIGWHLWCQTDSLLATWKDRKGWQLNQYLIGCHVHLSFTLQRWEDVEFTPLGEKNLLHLLFQCSICTYSELIWCSEYGLYVWQKLLPVISFALRIIENRTRTLFCTRVKSLMKGAMSPSSSIRGGSPVCKLFVLVWSVDKRMAAMKSTVLLQSSPNRLSGPL